MGRLKKMSYGFAKEVLFSIIPESIEIYDQEDAAYFIYSEFADYIMPTKS